MYPGFRQIIFGLLLWIPVTGCQVVTFSNPLVDPVDAQVPKELLGSYFLNHEMPLHQVDEFATPSDEDQPAASVEYQHVGVAGDDFPPGFVRIVRVDVPTCSSKKIEYASLVGFTVRMGDHFVLHIPLPKKLPIDESTYREKWDPENFEGYLLAILTPTRSGLDLSLVNPDFIVDEIRAGRLAGNYVPSQPVPRSDDTESNAQPELNVTADQDSLVAFFQRHIDGDLVGESPTRYQRVK